MWRKKWESSNDAKLKDTLIKYNYEDCLALQTITDFIYSIFCEKTPDDSNEKLENIALVKELKSHDEQPNYGNLDYVSEDIEVITKCAYFEYQRNKIFFRTNKNIRKVNQRKTKQLKLKLKTNKKFAFASYKCPFCKSKKITKYKNNPYEKIYIDLHISRYGIKKWITRYYAQLHYCFSCRKKFLPKNFEKIYPYSRRRCLERKKKKKSMIKNQKGFGHNLLAWVIHQHVVNKVPYKNVSKNLNDYFKLPIRLDDVYALKIVASNYYKVTYNKLFEKIVDGHLIHADETKINLQKDSGYVWVFTNMEEVFYLYRPNRESDFLHDLLEGFNGVLVTDFYSGYDSLKCPQQKCLVHLIRDLNNALLKNPLDDELKELVIMFGSLVRKIIDTIDRFGLKSRYMRKHKKDVKRFYKWLSKQRFNSELAENFRKRMIKYEKELFLCLDYDNVPWNNNNAEHAIKYFAKYRRLVNGKISHQGLEAYLILLSIYQTCNYRGVNFLDFLVSKEKSIDKYCEKF